LIAIECVLKAYRNAGITGSALRSKMTRAALAYEKGGRTPRNLLRIDDPELMNNVADCHKYHVSGVTFFKSVREAIVQASGIARQDDTKSGLLGGASPERAIGGCLEVKGGRWTDKANPGASEQREGSLEAEQSHHRDVLKKRFERQRPAGPKLMDTRSREWENLDVEEESDLFPRLLDRMKARIPLRERILTTPNDHRIIGGKGCRVGITFSTGSLHGALEQAPQERSGI